jgi:very-short-patch-repair endonuclease
MLGCGQPRRYFRLAWQADAVPEPAILRWRQLARAQHGVITRRQLRLAGLDDARVTSLSHRGELERVAGGVYLVAGAPWSYQAQLWSAVVATDGVLAFATAAYLWGVVGESADRVHVAVSHDRRPRSPAWIRLHRVAVSPWARTSRSGLAVTSLRWTVLDHLGTLGSAAALTLADRAIQRGWLEPQDLSRRLAGYPGRTGNVRLRELLAVVGDGAAAQSERLLHRLLLRARITGWVPNHDVWVNGELVAVVDVALPALRVAIEVDGHAYHSDVERFRRDRHRQNALVGLGRTVLRCTWADLVERPGYVTATLRHVLSTSGTQMRVR